MPAPLKLEDRGEATIDDLIKVDLGTKEDPRPTFISVHLSIEEQTHYLKFLKENQDVFA